MTGNVQLKPTARNRTEKNYTDEVSKMLCRFPMSAPKIYFVEKTAQSPSKVG